MATSKTLAPTNVTISIPAMNDAPDASVFSNCVDKEADAINALNSQLTTMFPTDAGWINNTDVDTLTSTGLYCIGTGNTNAGGSWGVMLVLRPRADMIEQLQFGYGGLLVREYRTSSGWTQWYSFVRQ